MKFEIHDEEELIEVEKFKKKHNRCAGRMSGSYIFSFQETGIGCVTWIECEACHERKNITNVKSW